MSDSRAIDRESRQVVREELLHFDWRPSTVEGCADRGFPVGTEANRQCVAERAAELRENQEIIARSGGPDR